MNQIADEIEAFQKKMLFCGEYAVKITNESTLSELME